MIRLWWCTYADDDEIFQIPIGIWGLYILKFWKFLKRLDIWGIFKKPRHLGNSLYTQSFGKFPRYPNSWEISQILMGIFKFLEISQMTGYLGNFPKTWWSGKFSKCTHNDKALVRMHNKDTQWVFYTSTLQCVSVV